MKTKKFLYDQELTHSFTKMNGIKICQIVLPPYKLAERDQSWQDK